MSEHQLLLLQAIEKGQTSIVLKLLRNHISLDVKDIYGCTPLILAAKHGRNEIAKILLEHMGGNASIDVDHGGKTALHYASENADLPTIKTLCKRQAPSMTMTTHQTKLLPMDYVLDDEDIYSAMNKYSQGKEVSGGESDDDDDDEPKPGLYVKKKKKKGTGKKKGGKKSGGKKKKKGGKKKK